MLLFFNRDSFSILVPSFQRVFLIDQLRLIALQIFLQAFRWAKDPNPFSYLSRLYNYWPTPVEPISPLIKENDVKTTGSGHLPRDERCCEQNWSLLNLWPILKDALSPTRAVIVFRHSCRSLAQWAESRLTYSSTDIPRCLLFCLLNSTSRPRPLTNVVTAQIMPIKKDGKKPQSSWVSPLSSVYL